MRLGKQILTVLNQDNNTIDPDISIGDLYLLSDILSNYGYCIQIERTYIGSSELSESYFEAFGWKDDEMPKIVKNAFGMYEEKERQNRAKDRVGLKIKVERIRDL